MYHWTFARISLYVYVQNVVKSSRNINYKIINRWIGYKKNDNLGRREERYWWWNWIFKVGKARNSKFKQQQATKYGLAKYRILSFKI